MIAGDTKRNSWGRPRLVNSALLEHAFGENDESWLNFDKPWIVASKVGTQYVLANVSQKSFLLLYFASNLKPHHSQQYTFQFLSGLANPAGFQCNCLYLKMHAKRYILSLKLGAKLIINESQWRTKTQKAENRMTF